MSFASPATTTGLVVCPDLHRSRLRMAQLQHPAARIVAFSEGQEVLGEGDPALRYYKAVEGLFRAVKFTPDGRRQVFAFYHPGDLFGLETGPCHGVSIEAVTEGLVAIFNRDDARHAMPRDPELALALFMGATQALDGATEHMMMVARSSAEERVAWFLHRLALRIGKPCPKTSVTKLHLAMNRRDMADHLGLTIETISRTLTSFRRRGVIAMRNARDLDILRPDRLAAIGAADRDGQRAQLAA